MEEEVLDADEEVIDLEHYNYRTKFVERFKMWLLDDLEFQVLRIVDLPPAYGLHFEEYNVVFDIRGLKFSINIISSKYEKENIIRKLTINLQEEEYHNEIASCINYLQRRRDLSYAIKSLHKYAVLRKQRELIGLYLLREMDSYLSVEYVLGEGFKLTCQDSRNEMFLFEAHWKVWWNCRNFQFFDYIKFSLTQENDFYTKCQKVMRELTKPTTSLSDKQSNWSKLIDNVKKFMDGHEPIFIENNNRETITAPIEISDSENESEDEDICFVNKSDAIEN